MVFPQRQNDQADRFETLLRIFVLRQDRKCRLDSNFIYGIAASAPEERQGCAQPGLRRRFGLLCPESVPRQFGQTRGQSRGALSHALFRMSQIRGQRLLKGSVIQLPRLIRHGFQGAAAHHRIRIFGQRQNKRPKILTRRPAQRPGHARAHKRRIGPGARRRGGRVQAAMHFSQDFHRANAHLRRNAVVCHDFGEWLRPQPRSQGHPISPRPGIQRLWRSQNSLHLGSGPPQPTTRI